MGPGRRHPRRETPGTLRLHVQLEGAFPPYHLYRFTTGPQFEPGAAFACTVDLAEGYDDELAVPTWDVRVDELLAEPGEPLFYQYDYGDNWWLAIEAAEDVAPAVEQACSEALERWARPVLAGERRIGIRSGRP